MNETQTSATGTTDTVGRYCRADGTYAGSKSTHSEHAARREPRGGTGKAGGGDVAYVTAGSMSSPRGERRADLSPPLTQDQQYNGKLIGPAQR